jgi:hypothetical protein
MEMLILLGERMNKKKEVFQFFQEKFCQLSEHHHHTARWIKNRLKDRAHVNFYRTWEENIKKERSLYDCSVYDLISRIEDVLDGHEYERRSSNSSDSKTVRTSMVNRPKATPDEDADIVGLAKKVEGKVEGLFNFRQRERRVNIKTIMTDAEVFIIEKQREFSEARITMRNAKTDRWRSRWGPDNIIEIS